MKDEVQGHWKGRKGASSFVFLTRRSSPTCLPSLPVGKLKLIHSLLKETQQITPINEHLTCRVLEMLHIYSNTKQSQKWLIGGLPQDVTLEVVKKKKRNK